MTDDISVEVNATDEVGMITVRIPQTAAMVRIEIPFNLSEEDSVLLSRVIRRLDQIIDWAIEQVVPTSVDDETLHRWLEGLS